MCEFPIQAAAQAAKQAHTWLMHLLCPAFFHRHGEPIACACFQSLCNLPEIIYTYSQKRTSRSVTVVVDRQHSSSPSLFQQSQTQFPYLIYGNHPLRRRSFIIWRYIQHHQHEVLDCAFSRYGWALAHLRLHFTRRRPGICFLSSLCHSTLTDPTALFRHFNG